MWKDYWLWRRTIPCGEGPLWKWKNMENGKYWKMENIGKWKIWKIENNGKVRNRKEI